MFGDRLLRNQSRSRTLLMIYYFNSWSSKRGMKQHGGIFAKLNHSLIKEYLSLIRDEHSMTWTLHPCQWSGLLVYWLERKQRQNQMTVHRLCQYSWSINDRRSAWKNKSFSQLFEWLFIIFCHCSTSSDSAWNSFSSFLQSVPAVLEQLHLSQRP